jgi:hypothetical protein
VIAVGYSSDGSFGGSGDWIGYTAKGGEDAIIVKYDNNNGDVMWANNFGGEGNDRYLAVTKISDDVIAAGYSNPNSFGTGDWHPDYTGNGNNDAIIVRYTDATGINDILETSNFFIYPNPAKNVLYVRLTVEKTTDYSIYNLMGQVVTRGRLQKETMINLETLTQGTYFLKIAGETVKIIKN